MFSKKFKKCQNQLIRDSTFNILGISQFARLSCCSIVMLIFMKPADSFAVAASVPAGPVDEQGDAIQA